MASLNTLRTKGGVIVSIVIGLALLAFLLSDLMSPGRGMFGRNKMNVGEIAGTTVSAEEYDREVNYMTNVAKLLYGSESLDAQGSEQVREMAWESMRMMHSYMPGFEKLGLCTGEAEQVDMTSGVYISPVIEGMFADPSTGRYNPALLNEFLARRQGDANVNLLWNYFQVQMAQDRIRNKFTALATQGIMVNDLEVEQGVQAANHSYSARYVSQSYASVADSLVTVSDSEIRAYYDKHKNMFRQGESRSLEYVVFDMVPSEQDYADAARRADEIAAEFAVAEDPMQYAQANSESNDARFVNPQTLSPEVAALLTADKGGMVGPELRGDRYTITRIGATRMMPDTIGVRHIMLARTDTKLADSLLLVLRKGGDFAALAAEFSLDQQTPGGDLGRFAPEQLPTPELMEACVKANKGDYFTVPTQRTIELMNLTYKTTPTLKVQLATVVFEVSPSDATIQNVYSQASAFHTAATGSKEKFDAAVAAQSLNKRMARVRNTDRTINGLEDSHLLVRWAFNASKGNVSGIEKAKVGGGRDEDYVVAVLTEVRHQGTADLADVASGIRSTLIREKKMALISAKMTGSTLDEVAAAIGAEVSSVTDLQQNAFSIEGLGGSEQQLIGAICGTTATGKLSKPVQGNTGVFLFDVTAITPAENATPESEKVRLESMAQYYIAGRANDALQEESKITDNRVKYF